jgi:hypothetical protein
MEKEKPTTEKSKDDLDTTGEKKCEKPTAEPITFIVDFLPPLDGLLPR